MNQVINVKNVRLFRCLFNFKCLNDQQTRTITRGRVEVLRELSKRSRDFDVYNHKLKHRNEWLDWNYDCEIFSFNHRLQEKFNEETLKKAFIFRSYLEKNTLKDENFEILSQIELDDNQELINLGQELCNEFIPKYLRYFLKDVPEEGIRAVQDYLLDEENLSFMSNSIGCNELILSDKIEPSKSTLAQAMLSLIGALCHDVGKDHAKNFIIDFVLTYLNSKDIMDIWKIGEPDKVLNSILKNSNLPNFECRLLRQTGVNTILPFYMIGAYCNKKLLGFGPGSSIEEATELSQLDALRRIFNLTVPKMFYKFGKESYNLDFNKFEKENISVKDYRIKEEEILKFK